MVSTARENCHIEKERSQGSLFVNLELTKCVSPRRLSIGNHEHELIDKLRGNQGPGDLTRRSHSRPQCQGTEHSHNVGRVVGRGERISRPFAACQTIELLRHAVFSRKKSYLVLQLGEDAKSESGGGVPGSGSQRPSQYCFGGQVVIFKKETAR